MFDSLDVENSHVMFCLGQILDFLGESIIFLMAQKKVINVVVLSTTWSIWKFVIPMFLKTLRREISIYWIVSKKWVLSTYQKELGLNWVA